MGHSKQKTVYVQGGSNMTSFRDRAIRLYSSLASAPSTVLPSRRTAPLSEACEPARSVSWLL
jgi:hypothetical protein